MAKFKISFTHNMSANANIQKLVNLTVNGEKIASTNLMEAKRIADANGKKNVAPFHLSGQSALIGGGVDFSVKGTGKLVLENHAGKPLSKPIEFEAANDSDVVKVKINKRGFPVNLILGTYKVKVKVKNK